MIEPDELKGYDAAEDDIQWNRDALRAQCRAIIGRLRESKRPVILAGTGVRLAGAMDVFNEVIHLLGIPVTTASASEVSKSVMKGFSLNTAIITIRAATATNAAEMRNRLCESIMGTHLRCSVQSAKPADR